MENRKQLTTNGLTTPHALYILVSLVMVGVSVYLTNHFYETYFPKGFGTADSLCEINSFWGCNKATTSILGKIFNVPTSFFGIFIGLIGIIGAIFPSSNMEKTNKLIIYFNALGCVGLFLFSVIGLKGLCPLCSVYYLLSWLAAYLFWKYSEISPGLDIKIAIIFAVLLIGPSIFLSLDFTKRQSKQVLLSGQYVEQFKKLQDLGDPAIESPFKIHMATDSFETSPIRISVFSDFECPFCKIVSTQMHEIIKEFKSLVNIQYYFYPLDNACNSQIKGSFHKYACMAAELAACSMDQFPKVHDTIFERQEQLSVENLKSWEKEFGLSNCFKEAKYKEQIQQTMAAAPQFNLKSTPTIIINGKKIEGTVPTVHMKAILKSLLEK